MHLFFLACLETLKIGLLIYFQSLFVIILVWQIETT